MTRVRVCVLEDPRIRGARLKRHLEKSGFQVEAARSGPTELEAMLSGRLPEVALVDVSHPSGDRLPALQRLAHMFPSMKVIGLLDEGDAAGKRSCRKTGAWDCFAKPRAPHRLAEEVRSAHAAQERPLPAALTAREKAVLRHLSGGEDNLKIAARLGITERTVKSHVTSLYRKLEAESRVELALVGRILS